MHIKQEGPKTENVEKRLVLPLLLKGRVVRGDLEWKLAWKSDLYRGEDKGGVTDY